MLQAHFDPTQRQLLIDLERLGGSVDYFSFLREPSERPLPFVERHRAAAIAGVEIIQRAEIERAGIVSTQLGIPLEEMATIEIDYAKAKRMHPEELSIATFLNETPSLASSTPSTLYPSAFFNSCGLTLNGGSSASRTAEVRRLFDTINDRILYLTTESRILRWPVDWSTFFTDETGGGPASAWTVGSDDERVVFICISSR
jgi:hypothetical protein